MPTAAPLNDQMGSYDDPMTGGGVQFSPLAVKSAQESVALLVAGYLPSRRHWTYSSIYSPFWRLYYDFRAGHRVVFPEREVLLDPGSILLIPDQQLFHCVGVGPRPKLWLHFTCPRRVAPDQRMPIELPVSPSALAVMKELKELIPDNAHDKHKPQILHASLALLHLVLSRPQIHWLDHKPAKLHQCLQFIENHYGEVIAIPELARRVHMSERPFTRMFQKHQGISPSQHIRQVRVRAASNRLLHTQQSLEQIAEEVGLATRAYLTRVFTRSTGISPARYRRSHGGA
jgi:AraC-like DNA-binding protein